MNTIKNQKFNFLAKFNSRKFKFLKYYRNLYGKSSAKREYRDENVFLKVRAKRGDFFFKVLN